MNKEKKHWYYLPEKHLFINTNKKKELIKKIHKVNIVLISSKEESLRTDKIRNYEYNN